MFIYRIASKIREHSMSDTIDLPSCLRHTRATDGIEHLSCKFGNDRIPILLGHRCVDAIVDAIIALQADTLFLVVDWTAFNHHGWAFYAALKSHPLRTAGIRIAAKITASERLKTLPTVTSILDSVTSHGSSRQSVIVSFGGGLTANLAGMVAGLLYRGVRLVHLPTTLLAASDGVLSLKQAVNGPSGKNQYGLYLKPSLVGIDVEWFSTLSHQQWTAGLVELAKNILAFDPDGLEPLLDDLNSDSTMCQAVRLTRRGIESKASLTVDDPHEGQRGQLLEYGHTIGHALEILVDGLPHGHAVGLGMLAAAEISYRRNWLSARDRELHWDLLRQIGAPLRPEGRISNNAVLQLVRKDNKHGRILCSDHEHPMVLLQRIGEAARTAGLPLVAVLEHEISAGMESLGWFD
jgi:3-dehydroquinate synthetase